MVVEEFLDLQRQAGNQAVQRLITLQRFTAGVDFPFSTRARADLPPSLELRGLAGGMERHHIVGDRKILQWIGDKKKNDLVPVNQWAQAALAAELDRARPMLKKEKETDAYKQGTGNKQDTTDVRTRIDNIDAKVEGTYAPLYLKFSSVSDESSPVLQVEEIDNLLAVLEWMPPNLLLGPKARKFDPGSSLDVEVLLKKKGEASRILLLKIAVAMGQVTMKQLRQIATSHKDGPKEKNWLALIDECASLGRNDVSPLFAKLVQMGDQGDRGTLVPSTTNEKQIIKSTAWDAFLLKVLSPSKKR